MSNICASASQKEKRESAVRKLYWKREWLNASQIWQNINLRLKTLTAPHAGETQRNPHPDTSVLKTNDKEKIWN